MQPDPARGRELLFQRIAAAATVLAALVSAIALAGWVLDTVWVARARSDFIPMAPSTAICLLLISAVLFLRVRLRGRKYEVAWTLLVSAVVLICYVLLAEFLIESVSGWEPDIEQWLVKRTEDPEGFVLGRMSPLAALQLILLAISTLMPYPPSRRYGPGFIVSQATATAVFTLACILIIGYWYGSPLLYGGEVTPVALPTAVGFFLLGLALLVGDPQAWLYRWFNSRSVAARFTRLVVPAAVTGILVIGWLHQVTEFISTPFEFSIVALLTAGIVTILTVSTARHIQEAVNAGERALRERTDFAEGLVESTAAWIWQTDADLRQTYTNAFVTSCLGYQPDEFLAFDTLSMIHPEDRDIMRKLDREALATKQGWGGQVLRWRHKDGSWRYIESSGMPLYDASGAFVGMQGIDRDVTERVEAEAELRASEERLNRSQEIARLGSWELDLEKNELTWSAEVYRIFGLEPQQFAATYEAFLDAVHPEDREAVDEAYTGSLREGRASYEIEHRIVRKDNGAERIVHEKCEHVRDGSGKVVRSVGMVHDVTEQKRSIKALEESEKRFSTVFNASPLAIAVTRISDSKLIDVNETWEEITGYSRDEAVGKTALSLDLWADPAEREQLMASFRTDSEAQLDIRMRIKSGEIIDAIMIAGQIDLAGERCMLSLTQDITERKQAEETIQQKNRDLSLLLDVSRTFTSTLELDSVLQAIVDSSISFTELDSAAVYLLEDDELYLGATAPTLPDQFPEGLRYAPLADHPHIKEAVHSHLPVVLNDTKTADLTDAEQVVVDARQLRSIIYLPLEVEARVLGVLILGAMESVRSFSGSEIDLYSTLSSQAALAIENSRLFATAKQELEDRKRTERALEESESLLRQSQVVAQVGHYIYDIPKGTWTGSAMLDEIFGIDADYSRKVDGWLGIIHPDDQEMMGRYLAEHVLGQRQPFDMEYRIKRVADGSEHWVHGLGQLDFDDEGTPIRMFGTIQDITERVRAEQSIRESEERYRTIFRDSPVAIWEEDFSAGKEYLDDLRASGVSDLSDYLVSNPDELGKLLSMLRVEDINDAGVKALGGTSREQIASDLPNFFTAESLNVFKDAIIALSEGQMSFSGEAALLDANGKQLVFEMMITVQPGYEDSLSRLLVSFVDLTKRKQSEGIIAARARLFEYAATHSLDELHEEMLNEAERLTGSSIGFFHMVTPDEKGLMLQQWSTRTKAEFCRAEGKGLHYDIESAGVWTDCIHERAPVVHNDYASLPHKKGMPEGHAEIVRELVAPVMRGGRVVAIIGVGNKATDYDFDDEVMASLLADLAWDITELKQAEQALRESDRRFRNIIDTSPVGMHMYDLYEDGRLVFAGANPAADLILGVDNAQFIGKTIEEAFPPLEQTELPERYREAARDGSPWYSEQIEYERDRISGAFEVYAFQTEPMKMVAMFNDVTRRKLAEEERESLREQLSRAQRMESVGRLAGGIAHDFNNMLGVIIGHAEIARTRLDRSDPLVNDLDEIHKAARRSADLTRQLLAFARRQATSPQVLYLTETVESMMGMLERMIGEDISLEFKSQPELWLVRIDPSQVDQLLANLMVNARDAIDDNGKISIILENETVSEKAASGTAGLEPGEYVKISVSDNGRGIDAEVLDHVFEPFFTTKGMAEGTGLGLATVYGIVKQNNGYIGVDSHPEAGTTFAIYLPRHAGGHDEEVAPRPADKPVQGSGETVLLVEDEPAVLKMAATMLRRLGYEVITALSPEEALELASANAGSIDLLLTDVVMPGMSGRELADRIGRILPGIGYLFMSGYTADVISDHGVIDDGVSFLQKPFTAEKLARALMQALHREEG